MPFRAHSHAHVKQRLSSLYVNGIRHDISFQSFTQTCSYVFRLVVALAMASDDACPFLVLMWHRHVSGKLALGKTSLGSIGVLASKTCMLSSLAIFQRYAQDTLICVRAGPKLSFSSLSSAHDEICHLLSFH